MAGTTIAKTDPRDIQLGTLELTATGISGQLTQPPTIDEFRAAVALIGRAATASNWWVGDLSNLADKWGDEYVQLLDGLGLPYEFVRDCAWVANSEPGKAGVAISDRSEKLSWTHHRAVARLTPPDQRRWLKKAHPKAGETTPKLSVAEFKKAIRQEKILKREAEARRIAAEKTGKPWVIAESEAVVQCQALVTDPPYGILDEPWEPTQLEKFTREWAERWSQCGADLLAVFWSQRYLREGHKWLAESFDGYAFQQLLVWHYPNNKSPQSRAGFKQTYEPVFLFRKDGAKREITIGAGADGEWGKDLTDFDCHVAAVPQSNFNGENMKQHPAQKPVSAMRWLVNALTSPGDLVCDPFCGSGTTGIAAMQLGRRFYGIELDPAYRKVAEGRIAEYGKAAVQPT